MRKLYRILLILFLLNFWVLSVQAQATEPLGTAAAVAEAYKAESKLLQKGAKTTRILHRVPGESPLELRLKTSKHEGDAEVYIGEVAKRKNSTFFLRVNGSQLEGNVILKEEKKAYQYTTAENGLVYLKAVDIDKVVCVEYQEGPSAGDMASGSEITAENTSPTELQSLPGATAVVLLDFNGQHVKGTYWNNGEEINAAPANLTAAETIEVWKLISEDFAPFDINITTNESVYFSAPINRRMRVIFTPTDFFYPGAGGVAYVNSFTWGNETPCWVFNRGVKYAGEAGSHEIGHTVGLSHDGRTSPQEAYYYGQGSWAPIMGAGYYKEQVQWSRGEYPAASNLEDDLGIITSQNGFGYRTDDHGNDNATATPLVTGAGEGIPASANRGIIGSRADVDVFSFETSGGNVILDVIPASAYTNLDVLLTLKNKANTNLAFADPAGAAASINQVLPAGTYYLHVKGAKGGQGADSDYSSTGGYSINATYNKVNNSIARLNAGGTSYTDTQSRAWVTDAHFKGGTISSKNFDVQGTTDDALYLTYRLANAGAPFSYQVPVSADGKYTVKLHFLEPYFGVPGGKTSNPGGARVFHADLEGLRVLSNYDIYTQDGAGKAIVKTYENVTVTGGTLDVNFTSVVNNAIISAIEVIPAPVVTYTLTTPSVGSGTVTRSPNKATYTSSEVVVLTATAATGYQFAGWTGDASGTANPLNVTMTANKTITANFTQQPVALVSEVAGTTGKSYVLDELIVGKAVYTDRTYQATTVPAFLNKAAMIRTANDDKRSTSSALLSFRLGQSATVYVAYDPRSTVLPAWLNGWQSSMEKIGVNDSKISYMNVYRKTFAAGTVSLGGNMVSPSSGAENNYFVLVLPSQSASAAGQTPEPIDKPRTNLSNAEAFLSVYPNPGAGDRVVVACENVGQHELLLLTVRDVLGRLIVEKQVQSNVQGKVSAELPLDRRLSPGLYVIRTEASGYKLQTKLLIE